MNMSISLSLNRELINIKAVNNAIGILFFVIAITLGAYVRIPLLVTPVPITLQTLFVLLAGAILGVRKGLAAQMTYIALGASGIPVFQGMASGTAAMMGPTAGYMAGFVVASIVVSILVRRSSDNIWHTFSAFVFTGFIILACGTAWLKYIYHTSYIQAIHIGMIPFIFGDIAKAALAAILYTKLFPRTRQIFS